MMSSNKNHLYSQLSKVRRLRNITDEGRLLLANRVNLLKKEEEEVQRKVEELVRKSENVLLAKFRHEKEIAKVKMGKGPKTFHPPPNPPPPLLLSARIDCT